MKPLVLTTSVFDYDGGTSTVDSVHMVPDDFVPESDYETFHRDLVAMKDPRIKWTKTGVIHGAYVNKAQKLWREHVAIRFGTTSHVSWDWSP